MVHIGNNNVKDAQLLCSTIENIIGAEADISVRQKALETMCILFKSEPVTISNCVFNGGDDTAPRGVDDDHSTRSLHGLS